MYMEQQLPKGREAAHQRHKRVLSALDAERQTWFHHWRTISDYFLPRRYPWLLTQREVRTPDRQNKKLLDSTSTLAVRTLASGMMNGITSPARQWFSLRLEGFREEDFSHDVRLWLEEVERRMYIVISGSNFYNAFAVLYLEWCTFGTASLGIYEDYNEVFRCYNYALGEFYLALDGTQRVNRHGRRVSRTITQLVDEFGSDALCEQSRQLYEAKDERMFSPVEIAHLIEPNDPEDKLLSVDAPYREVYWEIGGTLGKYLAVRPLYEWPNVTPRWELMGNDSYGTSPAMDALGDVKQLQTMLLERAQGLSKAIRPPLIVDAQLQNRPKALSAGGVTYAATMGQNFGAREVYKVNLPLQEIAYDVEQLQQRIRETCHNNLFNMISQLDTVRSATEIDARREEKLVHLGPVLDRFYKEGLDPALKRIYGIMDRAGLFPEAPAELDGKKIEIQYVSVLSDAQRAASTFTTERFLQFTGGLAGVYPEARDIPNVEELVRDYAENLGVKPKGLRARDEAAQRQAATEQQQALAQAAEVGSQFAAGAKNLSQADVGGGMNALQAMTGQ